MTRSWPGTSASISVGFRGDSVSMVSPGMGCKNTVYCDVFGLITQDIVFSEYCQGDLSGASERCIFTLKSMI